MGKEMAMARTNRISVPDAVYHVTTRIAHRAMLLHDGAVKDRVFELTYNTAFFSGVEVYSCCVMDNHLHILVHVPRVPERLWIDKAVEPAAYAFGMRPLECRGPIWQGLDAGAGLRPRPAVGFMLCDDEFEDRLSGIYGHEGAAARVAGWRALERAGRADRAMADRERLCRRMYNISQFMKTLKERMTRLFNSPEANIRHEGTLWQGRFHSGVVEPSAAVLATVAGYIEYNPVKAGIASAPESWRWSSFARAMGNDPLAETCRRMYAKMLGCTWEEACARMKAIFADGLPEDLAPESLQKICEQYVEGKRRAEGPDRHVDLRYDAMFWTEEHYVAPFCGKGEGAAAEQDEPRKIRASQAIRVTLRVFRGAFIGSVAFARRTLLKLPDGFPAAGAGAAFMCSAFSWKEPTVCAA
jgi:REP element-mobilizing transposase RayT